MTSFLLRSPSTTQLSGSRRKNKSKSQDEQKKVGKLEKIEATDVGSANKIKSSLLDFHSNDHRKRRLSSFWSWCEINWEFKMRNFNIKLFILSHSFQLTIPKWWPLFKESSCHRFLQKSMWVLSTIFVQKNIFRLKGDFPKLHGTSVKNGSIASFLSKALTRGAKYERR